RHTLSRTLLQVWCAAWVPDHGLSPNTSSMASAIAATASHTLSVTLSIISAYLICSLIVHPFATHQRRLHRGCLALRPARRNRSARTVLGGRHAVSPCRTRWNRRHTQPQTQAHKNNR